jgi:hypothetical protein
MVLAGVEGCVAVGELRYLWQRGMVEDRLCGCGEAFTKCPFWRDVMRLATTETGPIDPQRMMALQDRATRVRHLPGTFLTGARGHARLAEYPATLGAVLRAITQVANAHTVVDSSKLPPYGSVLRQVPDVDLRVIHLVRDPRATAYSWGQTKSQPDRGTPGVMQQQGAGRSALLWEAWNAYAALLGRSMGERYLRLRYEDLMADPATMLREVLATIGSRDAPLPLVDGTRRAKLVPSHTVAGNPDRFHAGEVELSSDDRWKSGLSRRDRLAVTAVAAPLMLRYGYAIGAPR